MDDVKLKEFLTESNRIEGITREVTSGELFIAAWFLGLPEIGVEHLQHVVEEFEPGAKLRNKTGMSVIVGKHRPMLGGPHMVGEVERLLFHVAPEYDCDRRTPFRNHVEYEKLHPFTDCNGHSGRLLWLWQMERQGGAPLGFLHTYYYQSLEASR